ncbi:MAG TPA: hypothetical protein DHV62_10400 [Elusimicrobia bacterium]|jgi:hypothetical protein|nr:hypothetical protein [Elusimicrobiota bacterium]
MQVEKRVFFQIIPNFIQESYEPGKTGKIGVSIINTGRSPFYLRKMGIQFDWQSKTQGYVVNKDLPIQPRRKYGLGIICFGIPTNITGSHTFKFFVDCIGFDPYLKVKYRKLIWTNSCRIVIHPTPKYRVFVSRSIESSDRIIIDPIVDLIRAWSVQPITVGINVKGSKDPRILEKIIVNEIKKSDGVICIATKRDRTVDGRWKTPAWIHAEAGISLYPHKPCLVFYDRDVTLEGIIWGKPKVPLNIQDYDEIQYKVDQVMGSYRNWVQKKKNDELIKTIRKMVAVGLYTYGIYSLGKEAGRRAKIR